MDEKFKTWQRKVYIFEEKIRNVEKQRADFRKVVLVQLLFHVPLHHIFYLGICDHRADNSCSAFYIYTIKKYVSKGIVVIFMLKIIMITYRRTLFPAHLSTPPPHTHTTTSCSFVKIIDYTQGVKTIDVCHTKIKVLPNYADDCINL